MAETIVFIAFALGLIVMYYKDKNDVKKRLAKMKNARNREITKKPSTKRNTKKKSLGHYSKPLTRPKYK